MRFTILYRRLIIIESLKRVKYILSRRLQLKLLIN